MKVLFLALLFSISATAGFAGKPSDGNELLTQMSKKYAGKWYRTLTFVQETAHFKPDGTKDIETWYEAMKVPGKLRIDIEPLDNHNGILFTDGKLFSFKNGKTTGGRDFVHPLLVLGFDVYGQPIETTISQVKGLGIDLSLIRKDKWQGRDVYVVGAKAGDNTSPQVWVDKKRLYFVRLIQTGKDKLSVNETQFNKYVKAKGGWVAAEVIFKTNGTITTTEAYSDIQADIELSDSLWDPNAWMIADRSYYKKK